MSRPPRPARLRRHDAGESVCAWCERVIPEGREVLGVGAKALPGVDLRRHQGRVTRLHLVTANRSVRAMVTGADSPARWEGHDLYFMVCSEACGAALRAALAEDIRIGGGTVVSDLTGRLECEGGRFSRTTEKQEDRELRVRGRLRRSETP